MGKLRIAIIGAGPCGLAQLLAFKQAEQEQQVELVCFERQSDWGGLWLYTSKIGIDVNGEPVHSSMYRHLWSNNPKELFEYPDYTFYNHFGCYLPSHLPRVLIYDYFIGRAKKNNLRQFIRFNTAVRHVDFNDDKKEFSIEIEDLNTNSFECLTFDRVIVANGHYQMPNMIDIDGLDQFSGRVIHSHEFRGADEFKNQNLLIIGSSFSADDIAVQCYKFGAKSITVSCRQKPIGYKWPSEIKDAAMITRIDGQTAHFNDGASVDNIDAIIICTGYRHSYPFMSRRLCLQADVTEFVPANLYKSIFWIDQPFVAYLGTPRQIFSFPMFDGQAALVRDVFLGHIKLPDKNEMKIDVDKWRTREKSMSPTDFFAMIDLQTDYMNDIIDLLHTYKNNQSLLTFDFNKGSEMTKRFLTNKVNDILHYRDASYESIVDTKHSKTIDICKPWIENMDDSMENLLNDYRKTLE
ncbi:unnamed protein product [Adineta steineri]|uniref:Flavin-containing monooxygenase n=1 Tax=Adineta steineri TaxID=433720 RepID=A0A814J342_9BILA|nr:unnamed protein product [Adineta steineri]CAF3975002.1 unnamed protein product [Adineta steineri]